MVKLQKFFPGFVYVTPLDMTPDNYEESEKMIRLNELLENLSRS